MVSKFKAWSAVLTCKVRSIRALRSFLLSVREGLPARMTLSALIVMTGLLGPEAWSVEKTASQWVDDMSRVFKERNYKGRFIYITDEQINTLQIFHKVKDGKEFERLERLSGEKADVIRNGHELRCLHPGDHFARLPEGIHSDPFAAKFREGKEGFASSYRLELGLQGKIAGRSAQQIIVSAQDKHRYDYELWVDEESAFLLKSVLRGFDGEVLEVFEFVELQLDVALKDSLFEFEASTNVKPAGHPRQLDDLSARDRDWSVTWNPPGFTLANKDVRHHPRGSSSMDVLMYADGLVTYTVFVEAVNKDLAFTTELVKHDGATTAYSKPMTACDMHWVTVVGELPLNTIKKIASSVTINK